VLTQDDSGSTGAHGAAAARALLDRRADLELGFVQHRRSGTVHILWPDDPDERGQQVRFADVPEERVLDLALGARPTLCGYVAREHLGGAGEGDQRTNVFADELLCARCHRSLGPHAARAFEHDRPDVEHLDLLDLHLDDRLAAADGREAGMTGPDLHGVDRSRTTLTGANLSGARR
jgi:hypothetical protein